MLKPFSKIFPVPFANITYLYLRQQFLVLAVRKSLDIRNISTVVNICVAIINRQQVQDIHTPNTAQLCHSYLVHTKQACQRFCYRCIVPDHCQ